MTMMGAAPMRSRNGRIAVEPVHAGQADVEHDRVERARIGDPQALLGGRGDLDVVPLVGEGLAECPADARLVVDDQDAAHAAPFRGPVRRREVRGEKRVSPSRSGPGEPPAVLGRHLLGQGQPEPDPFGLARDERLAQGVGQLGRRPRAGVGDLDGDLVAVRAASRLTVPAESRGLDGVQGQVQDRGTDARPVGEEFERPASSRMVEHDLRVLARRVDQQGDVREELPQVAGLGRPPLDAAEREQALDLLLGHRELPEGDVQAPVALRGPGSASRAAGRSSAPR